MALPYEDALSAVSWQDKEPEPQKASEAATQETEGGGANDDNDSEADAPGEKKGAKAPEKGHNKIPLRKPKSAAEAEAERAQRQKEEKAKKEEEASSTPRKIFPKRLWRPKTDYEHLAADKQQKEGEERRKQIAERGPRAPSPRKEQQDGAKGKKVFAVPVYDASWKTKLPEVMDLSFVPAKQEEELEKIVEKLVKKPKRKEPAVAEREPPMEEEELAKVTERLTRPKRRYDVEAEEHPKHQVIEPVKLEEEEVERIFTRLSTPRSGRRSNREFSPRHATLPRLTPERTAEVVGRLHTKNFFDDRSSKWAAVHPQGEGFNGSMDKVVAEFEAKSPKNKAAKRTS